MADYYTLITNTGLYKLANSDVSGVPVQITHIAVGDGLNGASYNPSQDQTALKHEVWRGAVNNKFIDPNNASKTIYETQIPVNVGGWYIRELGLFDSAGDLIAISKVSESYKATSQQGAADEYIARIPLLYSNTSATTITIDPAVVMASRQWVDQKILDIQKTERNFAKGQVISEIYNTVSTPDNVYGLWFFDETGATATIKDRSPKGLNLTLSKNANLLDPAFSGLAPSLQFNASDEYFEANDNDVFSFGDGSTDYPFSIITLVNLNAIDNRTILAKYDTTTGAEKKEWWFGLDSANKLRFNLYDTSANASISTYYDILPTGDIGKIKVYGATYNGSSINTGLNIYRDGVKINDQYAYSGTYKAMENLAAKVSNSYLDNSSSRVAIQSAKNFIVLLVKEELSSEQMKGLSQLLLGYANSL